VGVQVFERAFERKSMCVRERESVCVGAFVSERESVCVFV
jgi:hypothetical protein